MKSNYPPVPLTPAGAARVAEIAAQAGLSIEETQQRINELAQGLADVLTERRNERAMERIATKGERAA